MLSHKVIQGHQYLEHLYLMKSLPIIYVSNCLILNGKKRKSMLRVEDKQLNYFNKVSVLRYENGFVIELTL